MITIIRTSAQGVQNLDAPEAGSWIHLLMPSETEIADIAKQTGLSPANLYGATSELQQRQLTPLSQVTSIRLETPYIQTKNPRQFAYATESLRILATPHYLITIATQEVPLIEDYLHKHKKIEGFSTEKPLYLLLQMLERNCNLFFTYLRLIESSAERMEPALGKAMKNKELYEMLQLSKALSYYSMAFESNDVVYKGLAGFCEISDDETYKLLLTEVRSANRQLNALAEIQSRILSDTTDIVASMVSNNLNIVMKFMTAITIIMAIPTILSGLWGMNFPGLPFGNSSSGFYIVLGITFVISAIVAIIFYKKDMF